MGTPLRVTFISKSDLQGGAAIVTFRLMEAMRRLGVDARMLVCEKISESPHVEVCASPKQIKLKFLKERLDIFLRNGCSRRTLFKIDTATEGLPLWNHPWVMDADAICLGWINQGMLSLKGIRKIAAMGKKMVWTMHDMWNMTGVCHHAGTCERYKDKCGKCPLLGPMSKKNDISHKTWKRKKEAYAECGIDFVAVSSWLAGKALESSLLHDKNVTVIANAFPFDRPEEDSIGKGMNIGRDGRIRIIFGAARIDDPIKGLPTLLEALKEYADKYPDKAEKTELITFGAMKDPDCMNNVSLRHTHLGTLRGGQALRTAYEGCDIVVSSSDYETLPGTLIEGQAYGCIPVAFDHGGQRDIIDHLRTGYLAAWDEDRMKRASSLADGLAWAAGKAGDDALKVAMRKSVCERFSDMEVARKYIGLISRSI